ncbi:DUF2017 domain-containing protein [Brevibacterium album]|uniref:DUF2017 domain-containing protein n=1 Tax=Brevibacterium album TaxID=417948 RepID=UPI00040A116A|nr:DUF2017 domain-containing protein [Brevibacterium album]
MRILTDRISSGTLGLEMESGEHRILLALLTDVSQLLSQDMPDPPADPFERLVGHLDPDQHVTRPEDPALLRLLPDVDSSDPERSAEFRRLTETDLREDKLHRIRVVLESLRTAEVRPASGARTAELDRDTALAWMRVLTDVRLVLASRLEITDEEDAERILSGTEEHGDAVEAVISLYELTSWLQEHLTEFAALGLPDDGGDGDRA